MTFNKNSTSLGDLRAKYKQPPSREERRFEINLGVVASYMKCAYIKIPDPIYTKRKAKEPNIYPEHLRPFDGILVTPKDEEHAGGIYAIEAKYEYNRLERHQKDRLTVVNNANGMAYVIRMRRKANKEVYTIEWPEKCILLETDDLREFVQWFKNLSSYKNMLTPCEKEI